LEVQNVDLEWWHVPSVIDALSIAAARTHILDTVVVTAAMLDGAGIFSAYSGVRWAGVR
jgi:hypothetical protein